MIASPSPVHDTPPSVLSAYVPLPISAESPTRPGNLPKMPPVDVAAAIVPWRSSERDGVGDASDGADRAAAQAVALHDRGVELDGAGGGEHGAPAGVETRMVFQRAHRGFDGVHGTTSVAEDAPPGRHR